MPSKTISQRLLGLKPVLRRNYFTTTLVCAVLAAASTSPIRAANAYWDADANGANNGLSGVGLGGTGTWNTALLNWWPGSGTTDQAWVNANTDTAAFSGTPGTVTLAAPIV